MVNFCANKTAPFAQYCVNAGKPDIDVAYNDAIKNATDASKGVLEKLTDAGAATVLKMMTDKTSGTVTVPTKDGGSMVVKCEGGQCAPCEDCTP